MSSPTTPSVSARTGRPTSRSSSWWGCARSRTSSPCAPADANEVVEAWRTILKHKNRPACLALSRQALPTLDRSRYAPASGLARGAYVLADSTGAAPEVILIGTGSEVALCLAVHAQLAHEGIKIRVVSMPSWELFEAQDQAYRDSVLPPDVAARVSVEMGLGDRLGPLRRPERAADRHALVRCVGSP